MTVSLRLTRIIKKKLFPNTMKENKTAIVVGSTRSDKKLRKRNVSFFFFKWQHYNRFICISLWNERPCTVANEYKLIFVYLIFVFRSVWRCDRYFFYIFIRNRVCHELLRRSIYFWEIVIFFITFGYGYFGGISFYLLFFLYLTIEIPSTDWLATISPKLPHTFFFLFVMQAWLTRKKATK